MVSWHFRDSIFADCLVSMRFCAANADGVTAVRLIGQVRHMSARFLRSMRLDGSAPGGALTCGCRALFRLRQSTHVRDEFAARHRAHGRK